MECPTVRIKATSGSYPYTTINESDFDPSKHQWYDGKCSALESTTSPATPLEASAPAPDVSTGAPTHKRGRK